MKTLWPFHSKLVSLLYLHWKQIVIPDFRGLNPYFDNGSLYSFEDMVLRVLRQLESPKSDHRKSRYVLNNWDYSAFKQNQKLFEHSSPLNAFLSPKGSEFG